MSRIEPYFVADNGFVPLLAKVRAFVEQDMLQAEATRPGILAESRFLTQAEAPTAWMRAPGELVTGRVTDALG